MSKAHPITGSFKITQMDEWDQEFVDAEVPGFIRFDNDGGEFQFGYVHGNMDCLLTTRDGEPAVEWTWDGNDEMDAAQGRGWATLDGNEITGMIFFHQGDESEFKAIKSNNICDSET